MSAIKNMYKKEQIISKASKRNVKKSNVSDVEEKIRNLIEDTLNNNFIDAYIYDINLNKCKIGMIAKVLIMLNDEDAERAKNGELDVDEAKQKYFTIGLEKIKEELQKILGDLEILHAEIYDPYDMTFCITYEDEEYIELSYKIIARAKKENLYKLMLEAI